MSKYILAHDLGTTGNKATLYDANGMLKGSSFVGYNTNYPKINWAEQDADNWWDAVCQSTKNLLINSNVTNDEIAVISFSGQMMGCLPVDRKGNPLRKAIIWADQRSTTQAAHLEREIGEHQLYKLTGHKISPAYSVEKMMWLKENQPQIYNDTWKFLQAKDYIILKLTGKYVTDYSDASGTNAFDVTTRQWSKEILAAAGIDRDKLPEVESSFTIIGKVSKDAKEQIGLLPGTPVVIGGGDGVCAGVGAGVAVEGRAYNYIGSSSWVAVVTPEPIYDDQMRTFNWIHMDPNKFMPCGTMQSAGASYSWAKGILASLEEQVASNLAISPYELMNLQIEKTEPTAGNLIYLPYLMGERSPHWNPQARGAFIGLTITHTRQDMLRAVLEGVAFNLKIIIDAFQDKFQFREMRVIGGGAKGRVWRRIMADVYGKDILLPRFVEEATSLGAAIAGGIGVGIFSGLDEVEQLNPVVETTKPCPEHVDRYLQLYPCFKRSYEALTDLYEELAKLSN